MSKQVGPEHRAKHSFTEWLQSHGATVWWEEKNPWNHDTFTIERSAAAGGIPDLVVEIDGTVLVAEFKPGESVGQIYDALIQLVGYWTEHLTTDQSFVVDGRTVSVDGFVTASKHSRYGRLFPHYAEPEPTTPEDMDEGRSWCYREGVLPPREYRMTEQHIRTMWRLGKDRIASINGVRRGPHLGSILSAHLEREQFDPAPAVLWNRGSTNQDWQVFDQ